MVGIKVYYENLTGRVILTIPESHSVYAKETTKDEDFRMFTVLQERSKDTVDFIQLKYGQHEYDFRTANSWKVNLLTKEILFQYPAFQTSYETQIEQLNNEIGSLLLENAMLKAQVESLEESQGELIMEVAELKMGGFA